MTPIDKGTARLRADFNSVRDGETLIATVALDGTHVLPEVGDRVRVYDPEGNSCMGDVVARIDDESVRVRLDYATWEDARDESEEQVVDLMAALRESVMDAQQRAREKGVETRQEYEVDDFTITAA